MTGRRSTDPLLAEIHDALSLLSAFREGTTLPDDPLPSLVSQCQELLRASQKPHPMRTVHHLACTGGTVISKALAMLPNVVLLSELDPLSTIRVAKTGMPPFEPTDIILSLRHAHRKVAQQTLIDVFVEGALVAKKALDAHGLRMVIRDHSHSHFCTDADYNARPTLNAMLQRSIDMRSVVTVRRPIESFVSLAANNWKHFQPFTLGEYSRRYLAFLDRHAELPVHRYEDFTARPAETLQAMCADLALAFEPLALDLLALPRLTGDSGRRSAEIGPRTPKAVPRWIADDCEDLDYVELCARLHYDPKPELIGD